MDQIFLDAYIKVSVLIAAIDLFLAVKSLRKKKETGKYLGFACIGGAAVDISYLLSILGSGYQFVSVMSSIYFVSIDFMLVSLLLFTMHYTKRRFTKWEKLGIKLIIGYACFEAVVFAINPFHEIAIRYVWRDTFISKYNYDMLPLYWMHLIFTYSLVVLVVGALLHKMWVIPREYRKQYTFVILGILAVVAVNAVFLFLPGVSVYNLLDYSICGYSLIAFLLYWSCFNYSTHGMLNVLKNSIFENIDQGIVLFDYHDQLILHNKKAGQFLGESSLNEGMELGSFLEQHNISLYPSKTKGSYSLQCYTRDKNQVRPLRCDVRPLENGRGQLLGQLFVFTDAAMETDHLTSFQNWESFRKFAKENAGAIPLPHGSGCLRHQQSVGHQSQPGLQRRRPENQTSGGYHAQMLPPGNVLCPRPRGESHRALQSLQ